MFEHRGQPLLVQSDFVRRQAWYLAVGLGIVLASLAGGAAGYHFIEGLEWIDAILNAAMILGGMGPVTDLHTPAGKLFASFYALFSGVVFLAVVGLLFAPLIHRFLHRFHLELDSEGHDEIEP